MNYKIDTIPDVNSVTENETKSDILWDFIFHVQKYQPLEEKTFEMFLTPSTIYYDHRI